MIDFGKLSGLAYRFRLIVDGLRRTVPTHQIKDPSSCPLVGVIWSDLGRRMARFERLLARIEAGIPDRVRPSRAGRAAAPRQVATDAGMDAATAAPVARALRLPTRTGWLILMMPWVVAPYGSQLRYWLMEPEAEALVRSSRQMRRLLRPLLRSLSTDPLPECLLEPEAEAASGAPASGETSEGVAGEPAEPGRVAPASGEAPEDAAAPEPAVDDGIDATEPTDAGAPPARKRRVGRGVARAARCVVERAQAGPCAAQAGLPCAPQAELGCAPPAATAVSAPVPGCGFQSAAVEPPPRDWWSVQDERRRAALAIARGSYSRA